MILKNIVRKLILSGEEKELAERKFLIQNLDRISTTALFVIPVSLILILVFMANLHDGTLVDYKWRSGIIWAHLLLIVVLLSLSLIIYKIKKTDKLNVQLSNLLTHFGYIFVLSLGVLITYIDQLVTTAISPYFLVCIFLPLIIIIQPVYSIFYFLLTYIVFSILLPVYQYDTNVILSNYANGFTAMAFGIILSISLWSLNLARYRQEYVINQQKEKLEDQNARLIKLSEELKKINESKDSFFSILAHDLRSPVTGFIGLTKIIADEVNSLSEKQIKEMAATMNASAIEIYRLLNNLLEWSKVQRGFITLNPEPLNLSSLIDSCVQLYMAPAKEKNIKITKDIPQHIPLTADRHMLEIIIRNLISNALKFTNKGGSIQVSATAGSIGAVTLIVKENGLGMTPEIIKSLFDISGSINRKGTSGEPSSGLGLVLCKQYIDMHNGEIHVESEEGKGSTFSVTLPQNISLAGQG